MKTVCVITGVEANAMGELEKDVADDYSKYCAIKRAGRAKEFSYLSHYK